MSDRKRRICIPYHHQSSHPASIGGVKPGAWEDLPPELCMEIGIRLSSRLDILCFRSACKKWRTSLPCPTRFPLRVPRPPNCQWWKNNFYITEASIAVSKRSWLSFFKEPLCLWFEEVGQGGKFLARLLCPYESKLGFKAKHPLRMNLSFVSKAYHLRMCNRFGRLEYRSYTRKTVIISSNPTDGVSPSCARASDLSVVAHLRQGGRLALLRLGGSPQNWEWDTDFCTQAFEAIVTYRGRLCVLDRWGAVWVMDYNSLQMTQIAPPSSIPCKMEHKELFESRGHLYFAYMSPSTYIRKDVAYKLSLRKQKWVRFTDIGTVVTDVLPFQIRSQLSV